MQSLHDRPERKQTLHIGRVSEAAVFEIHSRLLPEVFTVACKRCGLVYREQKLIVPVRFARLVHLEEIHLVKRAVHLRTVGILVNHRPRLVRVRQQELEHNLEQIRICGVLHYLSAFQSSGGLCRCELLCRTRGCRAVLASLERIRNTNQITHCRVGAVFKRHIAGNIRLQGQNIEHRLFACILYLKDFEILVRASNLLALWQGDNRAAAQQLLRDCAVELVNQHLLISYHVHVRRS